MASEDHALIAPTRRQAIAAGITAVTSLALLEAEPAAAADPGAAGPRSETSFDEDWRFLRGDASGAQAPSFDDSAWRPLDLPHDFSLEDLPGATSDDGGATADPAGWAYATDPSLSTAAPEVIGPFSKKNSPGKRSSGYTLGGIGWYRKRFRTPSRRGERVELRFDGVYQNADVWLNGEHLGFHPNGYTSFAYDITPHLRRGDDNVMAVRVDTTGLHSRWYSGSGIYRHTWLTTTGPVRVPLWGVGIETPVVDAARSRVRSDVRVANAGDNDVVARVQQTLRDPAGKVVARHTSDPRAVEAGKETTFTLEQAIDRAELWSPGSPSLYTAETHVLRDGRLIDEVRDSFGIRSLAWDGTRGMSLNGEPLKVLGGNIHHDNGPLGAVALRRSADRRIAILKEAGFNAIRTSHNPPDPALLDACDRLGMFVFDEFTDMWDRPRGGAQDYSNHFVEWWKRDLTSMVLRDRNHPSVIIWCIANQVSDGTGGQRGKELADHVRSLDATRPVTNALATFTDSKNPAFGYVDIADVHYANITQHLAGLPGTNLTQLHADHPDLAFAQSESLPATIYDDWKFAEDHPWMIGSWVWAAWDYIGEAGVGITPIGPTREAATAVALGAVAAGTVPYPWFSASCTDIDLIGQPRPQNRWRQVVYGRSPLELAVERPTPPGTEQHAVAFGYYDELESWTWDVLPAQPMKVRVYTSGDRVTLRLNGLELLTNLVTELDKRVTSFRVPYLPGELTAIAYRGDKEIGRKTLVTAGAPAALKLTSDVKALTTGRDDLAHVLVEVVDAQGRRVPDTVKKVSFTVSGAGELLGVANGNAHNVDSFQKPRRHTYHGQALAVLRPAKKGGTVRLVASADGLRSATLDLPVSPTRGPEVPARAERHQTAGVSGVGALAVAAGAAFLRRRGRAFDAT